MTRMVRVALAVAALVLVANPARAELIDLGNRMIYDTVQDLTWMQDAWYSRADAPDACFDGQPGCFSTYAAAETWASNLTFGGYDDWRLPARLPGRPPELCPSGACSEGHSEISIMLTELGWHWGSVPGSSSPWYLSGGSGPFLNLQATYWLAPGYWWSQHEDVFLPESYGTRAWAVRDGLARVPEPATLMMIGLGALGLIGLRRTTGQVK